MATLEGLHPVGRLALQCGFDFLRNDGATEHTGKRVTDGDFEPALDALHETHVTVLSL